MEPGGYALWGVVGQTAAIYVGSKTNRYMPCGEDPTKDAPPPVLSREGNRTYIRPDCGTAEMLEGLHRFETGM